MRIGTKSLLDCLSSRLVFGLFTPWRFRSTPPLSRLWRLYSSSSTIPDPMSHESSWWDYSLLCTRSILILFYVHNLHRNTTTAAVPWMNKFVFCLFLFSCKWACITCIRNVDWDKKMFHGWFSFISLGSHLLAQCQTKRSNQKISIETNNWKLEIRIKL